MKRLISLGICIMMIMGMAGCQRNQGDSDTHNMSTDNTELISSNNEKNSTDSELVDSSQTQESPDITEETYESVGIEVTDNLKILDGRTGRIFDLTGQESIEIINSVVSELHYITKEPADDANGSSYNLFYKDDGGKEVSRISFVGLDNRMTYDGFYYELPEEELYKLYAYIADCCMLTVLDEYQILKSDLNRYSSIEEEDLQMIDFLDKYNGRILESDYQPIERMAILNTEVGIRAFPDDQSPIFGYDEITYKENPIADYIVTVYANFDSPEYPGWAFITRDYFSSGYVKLDELSPYEFELSYEPKEQFRDFTIGVGSEVILNYFDREVSLINDRTGWGYVIRVVIEEDPSYADIDFWYNPADNRISVINTNSDQYPLASGFKVGDSADEVFAYYDQLYDECEYFSEGDYKRYDIGDGYSLDFGVSDGVITFIMINGGLYSYV